jgi:hypothetical protein
MYCISAGIQSCKDCFRPQHKLQAFRLGMMSCRFCFLLHPHDHRWTVGTLGCRICCLGLRNQLCKSIHMSLLCFPCTYYQGISWHKTLSSHLHKYQCLLQDSLRRIFLSSNQRTSWEQSRDTKRHNCRFDWRQNNWVVWGKLKRIYLLSCQHKFLLESVNNEWRIFVFSCQHKCWVGTRKHMCEYRCGQIEMEFVDKLWRILWWRSQRSNFRRQMSNFGR